MATVSANLSRSTVLLTLTAVLFLRYARAAAIPAPEGMLRRQAITALTTAQIDAFRPYTHYASTGYCTPASTLAWNCGPNCAANPSFMPIASGGDGDTTQFWYVGFDPTLHEVIVGHQGTNTSEILSILEDSDIILQSLDSTLFPGVSSSVKAHSGFVESHSRSAPHVLAAVRSTLATFGANKMTITGHSLGAAIAQLDALYLPLHIPGTTVRYVGYGVPRVGNQAFANYVDAQSISVTHINNKEDIVPILPGMFLGYHHPSGEIHIQDSGAWLACPGQDNENKECIVGDVPNIFEGDESDHDGPYDGIEMGC